MRANILANNGHIWSKLVMSLWTCCLVKLIFLWVWVFKIFIKSLTHTTHKKIKEWVMQDVPHPADCCGQPAQLWPCTSWGARLDWLWLYKWRQFVCQVSLNSTPELEAVSKFLLLGAIQLYLILSQLATHVEKFQINQACQRLSQCLALDYWEVLRRLAFSQLCRKNSRSGSIPLLSGVVCCLGRPAN